MSVNVDTLTTGDLLLFIDPTLPASPRVNLTRYLVSLLSMIPVINGASGAAERSDWTSVVCVIVYNGITQVIDAEPNADGTTELYIYPIRDFLTHRRISQCVVRRLYAAQSGPTLDARFLQASQDIERDTQNTKWRDDEATLVADLYFRALGVTLDTSDETRTVSALFATGGAIDVVLDETAKRAYHLGPETPLQIKSRLE